MPFMHFCRIDFKKKYPFPHFSTTETYLYLPVHFSQVPRFQYVLIRINTLIIINTIYYDVSQYPLSRAVRSISVICPLPLTFRKVFIFPFSHTRQMMASSSSSISIFPSSGNCFFMISMFCFLFFSSIGKEPVISDPVISVRENMVQEPSDKLFRSQGHFLVFFLGVFFLVVFV